MPRIGVIGSFVWDVIHGRSASPVEEWGGIGYALSGLDAALPNDWEIVPIIRVGSDLAARANHFLRTLKHAAPDAPAIAVPYPNARVELRYYSDERRTEVISGGAPAWSWLGLKPALDAARLDALYINFLTGWELELETARLIRQHFRGPVYCDMHMLVWSVQAGGRRELRPLPNVAEWCSCFDFLQMNEDEMAMMAPDPMALAATALANGVRTLVVTLGKRGAVYFAPSDFDTIADLRASRPLGASFGPLRTALVPVSDLGALLDDGDPTGCGDVWGATYYSRLLAGDRLDNAISAAHQAAARNLRHRGATGLANHLRGTISLS
jgi:sugar/nucleoside kinase (ribokinase family)